MDYQKLAAHSRIWIYQADRSLSADEVEQINKAGEKFVEAWAAHGAELSAAFSIFHNRFLVLFVDEQLVPASGCSIDSSVNFIKKVEQDYQIDLFNRTNITYKKDGAIASMPLSDFQEALSEGILNENTIVFNNLVETKADFENEWEIPVKNSWHAQLMV